MNSNTEALKINFDTSFRDNICNISKKEEVLQVYLGGLSGETVFSICSELETTLKRKKFPKVIIKRTFFLALEIIQNQLLHGSKDHDKKQYNYFICTSNEKDINIYASNLVKKEECVALTERINHINEMLIEKTLHSLYLEQLNNDKFSSKGGGGLGFIKMAMVTGNPVCYNFTGESPEFSFLDVHVHLSHANTDNLNNINFDEVLSLLN